MKAYWGSGGIAHAFLTSALDRGELSASHTGRITPTKRTLDTHWSGGGMDLIAGLDAVVKKNIPSYCWDSNPRIIQLVVQPYATELPRILTLYVRWVGILN
jgi:hypothetical protein